MSVKWIKAKATGIRYYQHQSRKHGVRKDRYFTIRYRSNGKVKEEALGWESQGWTESKVVARLAELKEAQRTGVGEKTLANKRKVAMEKEQEREASRIQFEKEQVTFASIFERYFEQAKLDKNKDTCKNEILIFNKWFKPLIGNMPMKDISPFVLEKLKKQMKDAGKAPATITRDLGIIGRIFNYARNNDLYNGDNPVSKVKKPSEDNKRTRHLSKEEAKLLLNELKKVSTTTHNCALISLHCGLRAGEIFKLT
jgi:hypothetical protein